MQVRTSFKESLSTKDEYLINPFEQIRCHVGTRMDGANGEALCIGADEILRLVSWRLGLLLDRLQDYSRMPLTTFRGLPARKVQRIHIALSIRNSVKF